jgi:hypothetical protein
VRRAVPLTNDPPPRFWKPLLDVLPLAAAAAAIMHQLSAAPAALSCCAAHHRDPLVPAPQLDMLLFYKLLLLQVELLRRDLC